MLLFLHGAENFLSKRKLNKIVKNYRSKHQSGLNFAKFEASKDNWEKIKDKIETVSIFQEKKLIVIRNTLSAPKSLQDEIEKYLKEKGLANSEKTIIIFFENDQVKKNSSLFKKLDKHSFQKQEFKKLSSKETKDFILKEIKKSSPSPSEIGGEISTSAIDKLISFYGNDLWQITNELNKLVAFKGKDKIQPKDIENLGHKDIEPNIFKTIEAISKKDKKTALNLISDHLQKGENEMRIISMIVYQVRNLLKVKSLAEQGKNWFQIHKTSKLHPFVVKKTLPIANMFSIQELKDIYKKLLELDFNIKTGRIDPELGIQNFIIEI